jgi:alcohol dehydrogenase class IV
MLSFHDNDILSKFEAHTMSIEIQIPAVLRIGGGSITYVPSILEGLSCKRPLIVTDPFILNSGLPASIEARLQQAGIWSSIFSDTVPDPTSAVVDLGVQAFGAGEHDSLISLGGGSSIDTAKAISMLAANGGICRTYKVPNPIPLAGAPHIAIPTTAGTGSEVTRFTVITDPVTNEKMLIAGPTLLPTAAVVDFELTLTMPARLTADTGIDSLTHAIEAYVSRRSNSFSDSVAQLAMRDIWRYLPIAFFTPSDRIAREAMMTAATLAGMAFSNSSVALVHGMSRPIGAHFHVPHGLSNAMLLPVVTRFSAPTVPTRYADCARAMGLASSADSDSIAVDRLLAGLFDLNRDLKVPSPKAYGIDEQKYRNLIPTMALQALASGSPSNNPRIPTAADIEQLYRDVWESPEPYPASSDLARRL